MLDRVGRRDIRLGRSSMKWLSACALTLLAAASSTPARAGDANPKTRDDAVAAVVRLREDLIGLADRVWSYAETALHERKSAEALADYA
jgi:hypothetical protein